MSTADERSASPGDDAPETKSPRRAKRRRRLQAMETQLSMLSALVGKPESAPAEPPAQSEQIGDLRGALYLLRRSRKRPT
jgi:hypothetical protein